MDKLTVDAIMPQIWAYMDAPGNGVGGSLHIVLDDGNHDKRHIQWCIDYAEERKDAEGARIGRLLLGMTKTQLKKISERLYTQDKHYGH